MDWALGQRPKHSLLGESGYVSVIEWLYIYCLYTYMVYMVYIICIYNMYIYIHIYNYIYRDTYPARLAISNDESVHILYE